MCYILEYFVIKCHKKLQDPYKREINATSAYKIRTAIFMNRWKVSEIKEHGAMVFLNGTTVIRSFMKVR